MIGSVGWRESILDVIARRPLIRVHQTWKIIYKYCLILEACIIKSKLSVSWLADGEAVVSSGGANLPTLA